MFPDSDFAAPTSSFNHPVPPPLVEPDSSPSVTVTFACAWLPYVRGALQQLLLQTTWDTADETVLNMTQGQAFNLICLFTECSGGIPITCSYNWQFDGNEDGWYSDGGGSCDIGANWLGAGWGSRYIGSYPGCDNQSVLSISKALESNTTIYSISVTYTSLVALEVAVIDHCAGCTDGTWDQLYPLPAGTEVTQVLAVNHMFPSHLRFFFDNHPSGGGDEEFTLYSCTIVATTSSGDCT